jgi:hypothetical protein
MKGCEVKWFKISNSIKPKMTDTCKTKLDWSYGYGV